MWTPTSSTAGESWARATARAASPDRHPEAELGVDLPGAHELVGVRLDAGGGPDQHLGHEPVVGVEGWRAARARRSCRPRSAPHRRGAADAELLERLVVAVQHEPVGRARPQSAPRAARRPWPRRGASPPRGRGGPWPGTGRPWTRRPHRLRTRPPPRGSAAAEVRLVVHEQRGAELRRQLEQVASADAEATVARRSSAESGSRCRGSGPLTSPREPRRRGGRARWRGRCGSPRRATDEPG